MLSNLTGSARISLHDARTAFEYIPSRNERDLGVLGTGVGGEKPNQYGTQRKRTAHSDIGLR